MNQNEGGSFDGSESETANLELYRTAHARLTFQDEYLFKFSTVFLTAHGGLAVLAGTAMFRNEPSYVALTILSTVGCFLALVWFYWTIHNDYWHAIWTGALRKTESHLRTEARVFNWDHVELAKEGGRSKPSLSGHQIAKLLPSVFFLGWLSSLIFALGN